MHTPDATDVAQQYAAEHTAESRGDIETIMRVISEPPPAA